VFFSVLGLVVLIVGVYGCRVSARRRAERNERTRRAADELDNKQAPLMGGEPPHYTP
jgi:hypothetical protein